MRLHRIMLLSAAVLSPGVALAQSTPPPATPPAGAGQAQTQPQTPRGFSGLVDFGVRGSSVEDDGARYERYRDLGDGAFMEVFRWNGQPGNWFLNLAADHVGRRDQRYTAGAALPGRLKIWGQYDQIPMLLSRTTRTLFDEGSPGVLQIGDNLQQQVQSTPASLAAVFTNNARTFDTRSLRKIGEGGFEYLASTDLTVRGYVRRTNRSGSIPYGGSFGHSSVVELPAPVEHGLTDFEASAEWARDAWLFRGGYTGSWFNNEFTTLTWDSPFRLTSTASAPAIGRLSLSPSNSFIAVNGLASVKLPYRSRATASVSVGTLKDAGDPIMPQTINPALNPAALERSTVEGEARTTSVNLNFTSRPMSRVDVQARLRTYEYDNRTPEFAMTQRVSYDNSPAAVNPAVHTEPFGINRSLFDADARYTIRPRLTAGIGYSRAGEDRNHRTFSETTDHVTRVTFDVMNMGWLTLRSKYEHGERRGKGLDDGVAGLVAIGEQPGMRQFDVANRDRNRVTVLGGIVPGGAFSFTGSIAAGKDDFLQSEFGLRDNTHRVYSIGTDYVPGDNASFGLSYTFERYNALSRSRQANPGAQFTDPSRNWAADGTDRAHSVLASAEFTGLGKLDLRFNYDFSRARATYEYITGPVADRTLPEEVIVDTTLPTPTQLPPTLSELHSARADATYNVSSRLGLGISLWFERYRVEDFTLDVDANPDLVRGQAVLMGYLYRPYNATTLWVRMLYRF